MTADYPTALPSYGQTGFHKTSNLGNSTLASSISNSQTTITVVNATNVLAWPTANFIIKIENELIFVASRTSNTLNSCIRGYGSPPTTAVSHPSATAVLVVLDSEDIQKVHDEIIAITTDLGIASAPNYVKNVTNLGTGEGIFAQKNLYNLELKSIKAGTGIAVTANGTEVTITASGSSTGLTCNETFLTLVQESTLPQSRYVLPELGISYVDDGAQNAFHIKLDQAYSPTWTGTHIFNNSITTPSIKQGVSGSIITLGAADVTYTAATTDHVFKSAAATIFEIKTSITQTTNPFYVQSTYIQFDELGAAPSTPATGIGRLYAKSTDKHIYWIDSLGMEYDLTTAGGGGGGVTGSGSIGRVAYWNSTTSINDDSLFNWDDAIHSLGVGDAAGATTRFTVLPLTSLAGSTNAIVPGVAYEDTTLNFTTAQTGNVYTTRLGALTVTGTASQTIPVGATLYIESAPINGANTTITNPYAVWVDNGVSRFDDVIEAKALSTAAIKVTSTTSGIAVGTTSLTRFEKLNFTGSYSTEGSASAHTWGILSNAATITYTSSPNTGDVSGHVLGQVTVVQPSAGTVPVGATLKIAGPLIAGANTTFTNNYALLVSSGNVKYGTGFSWVDSTNQLTLASGTITTDLPAFNLTQTWNNSGTVFKAFDINVTNTASGSGSVLLSVREGGTNRFSVDRAGAAVLNTSAGMSLTANSNITTTLGVLATGNASISASASIAAMSIGATAIIAGERLRIAGPRDSFGATGSATARALIMRQESGTYPFATSAQTGDVYGWFLDQVTVTNPSSGTIANGASLYVKGPMVAGTNVTLTNPYSIWVDDGKSRFDGVVQAETDVYVNDSAKGFVLKDSGGHYWRLTIGTTGILTATDIGTTAP